MRVHYIVSSGQRALGAMFSKDLNEEILVFFYPHSAKRTFHTYFCPPIKIVALDEDGQVVFEQVVSDWRLVRLPACKIVIETGPKVDYRPFLDAILSYQAPFPQGGAVEPGVDLGPCFLPCCPRPWPTCAGYVIRRDTRYVLKSNETSSPCGNAARW